MNDIITILVSAILSGIFATIITLLWQSKSQTKQKKINIFTILMSKRYDISSEECVNALNMIDIVFYDSAKVRTAWKNFNDATTLQNPNIRPQEIRDKHLKLLEMIADDIGYKNIKWEDIKQYYYPKSLSDKMKDEETLRKVQIGIGIAQIQKEDKNEKDPINIYK